MRGQSSVISTVLLSGIILAIVTATFVWGQPLVQKTTDKAKIDSMINDLNIIKDKISHTQQTGSPSVITLNINDATYRISQSDNSFLIKTNTLIPIITSYTYIPIDYTELAYETGLIDINTSDTNDSVISTPNGYDGGVIHFGNISINDEDYNVSVYNTSNTVFDHVCIFNDSDINDLSSDCAEELGTIYKKGVEYTVSWVDDDGVEVILSGGEKENIGVLGTDPAGVISGKSQPISGKQHVSIKLSYRGLKDVTGHTYKTIIRCSSNCRASDGVKRLRIERDRVERSANETNYYIKMYFE